MVPWKRLTELVRQIAATHGGAVHDYRCGKTWDAGQAICAMVYGPEWSKSPRFLSDDSEEKGAPAEAVQVAEAVLRDGYPEYLKPV